jgi:hypothetical protein
MGEVVKVVCINNTKDGVKVSNLTQGKVYDSYSQSVGPDDFTTIGRILIVNDKGVKEWYNNELFISLHEWRDWRLNEIVIL